MSVERISTVLVAATATPPAGPYDLTTLAIIRDELSITDPNDTSNDASFSRWITEVSTNIANDCNRVFPVEALQDQIYPEQDPYPFQVPGGQRSLQLARWPIVNAVAVSFTGNTHGTVTVDGIPSTAGVVDGSLAFAADGSIPAGTTVASHTGTSITLSAAATTSVTGLSMNTGIQVIQTLATGNFNTLVYGTDFIVDAARGWLIRLNSWTGIQEPWEAEPTTVQYQAGYAKIPSDLAGVCLRLVTERFKSRGREPMLRGIDQPGVGRKEYWVGATPGQTGPYPNDIMTVLDRYRVPVSA